MPYVQKGPQNFNDIFKKSIKCKTFFNFGILVAPIFGSFYSEAFIGLDSWNDFYFLLRRRMAEFPGSPGVRTLLSLLRVQSLVGELNCHKP